MSAASTGSSCAPGQVARVVVSAPWTPADLDRACAMYAAGYGSIAIGRALSCAHTTVTRRLRAAGVVIRPPRGRAKPWTDADLERYAGDYMRGRSLRSIARECGSHHPNVQDWLRAAGVVPVAPSYCGRRRVMTPERIAAAIERYAAGESCGSIARGWGVTSGSVWYALRAAGVETRKCSGAGYSVRDALEAKRAGATWNEIGARFGVLGPTVAHRCKRAILAGRARA